MGTSYTLIGYSKSKVVAKGVMTVAGWSDDMPIPTLETFVAALSPYGEVWQFAHGVKHPHVGLTLSRNITEYDLQVAFANANGGNVPKSVISISGIDTAVKLNELSESAQTEVIDGIEKAASAAGTSARWALWFATYGIWVILGVLALGVLLVIVFAAKKKASNDG
jgi:hypothetical protein